MRSSVKQAGADALTIDYEREDTVAWEVYDVKVAGIDAPIRACLQERATGAAAQIATSASGSSRSYSFLTTE